MDFGTWLPSAEFFNNLISSPALIITMLLTLGVVFVNGWTDAPNSIATCVSTRCMRPRSAVLMAAFFDFLGVFVMTLISGQVANTMAGMLNFGSGKDAVIALCAGMVGVVVWATVAWVFGLPSSESHALIAGISGAAIAVCGGLSGINFGEWKKVIYGLILSAVLGFVLGFIYTKCVRQVFRRSNRRKANTAFKYSQIGSGAFMAFMHGAQDGQKFIAVFVLGTFLSRSIPTESITGTQIPIWIMILFSGIMACGTSLGGYRIIKSVGMDMVKLERYEGFSADLAGATCLMVATLTGLPVSTTHAKTVAIMGVGASKRMSNVNWSLAKELVYSWLLVFPGCGLIGYGLTWLSLRLF